MEGGNFWREKCAPAYSVRFWTACSELIPFENCELGFALLQCLMLDHISKDSRPRASQLTNSSIHIFWISIKFFNNQTTNTKKEHQFKHLPGNCIKSIRNDWGEG